MKNYFRILLSVFFLMSSARAATMGGFEPEFYGFLKTSAMFSDHALGSFNNINLSAPTHAVAETRTQDKVSRVSFQTQQSRVGFTLSKASDIKARFEFDFVDFAKSSPTTQMNPRVRIASITYVKNDYKFIVGQDWDLFSPVTSYTFDYVGLYFQAGNTGFQRQQLQILKTKNEWEYGLALGMAGNNPGTIDNDLELSKSPSYAGRITRQLENGRAGFSAIYANLKYFTNERRHDTYGLNLFFEKLSQLPP